MKSFPLFVLALGLSALCSCNQPSSSSSKEEGVTSDTVNSVIENILTRRSIRQYSPKPVNRDTLQTILKCGIYAPNGMHKESWQVRVTDDPDFINGFTEVYKKANPGIASRPGFRNAFNNAPTVIFVAYDTTYDCSQVDCGMLGENIMLSAHSLGIGSCCMAGVVRFMNQSPDAAPYLQRLDLPSTHRLLFAIALGYPEENPKAGPRDMGRVKFVE